MEKRTFEQVSPLLANHLQKLVDYTAVGYKRKAITKSDKFMGIFPNYDNTRDVAIFRCNKSRYKLVMSYSIGLTEKYNFRNERITYSEFNRRDYMYELYNFQHHVNDETYKTVVYIVEGPILERVLECMIENKGINISDLYFMSLNNQKNK